MSCDVIDPAAAGGKESDGMQAYLIPAGGALMALIVFILFCYCCYMRCCKATPNTHPNGVPPSTGANISYLPLGELNPVDTFASYRESPGPSPDVDMELRGHSAL